MAKYLRTNYNIYIWRVSHEKIQQLACSWYRPVLGEVVDEIRLADDVPALIGERSELTAVEKFIDFVLPEGQPLGDLCGGEYVVCSDLALSAPPNCLSNLLMPPFASLQRAAAFVLRSC